MNDDFHFGEPAKRPARLRGAPSAHTGRSFDLRLLWIGAGLVAAAVAAFVFLNGADEAGKQIADAQLDTVAQIDRAYDNRAHNRRSATPSWWRRPLHAKYGDFTTDLATLSAYDPTLRFTSGPSDGPGTVSYAVSGSEFGAAVRSESGTCWWVKIAASSVTTYGSGSACTGSAAMAASAPSW